MLNCYNGTTSKIAANDNYQIIDNLHGVKYITCNAFGDIYWKGVFIDQLDNVLSWEHYDYVQELGMACQNLERLKVVVNSATAGTHRGWFSEMTYDEPYKLVLSRCPEIFTGSGRILIRFRQAACEFDGEGWNYYLLGNYACCHRWLYTTVLDDGDYDSCSLSGSELRDVLSCLKHYGVSTTLLSDMAHAFNPRKIS